jgi:hypothetical protein
MPDSAMRLRAFATLILGLATALLMGVGEDARAQVRVRTETIRPSSAMPPAVNQFVPEAPDGARASEPAAGTATPSKTQPDDAAEAATLPPAVKEMRERIIAAASSGDLENLLKLMHANGSMPVFTHTLRQDPATYWKDIYPDSDGVEILSILISILNTPAARIDAGTPQEMYVWPYFARLPIKSLTPAQKVELFRVVTGSDYRQMVERGRYVFYQVGISPDGAWRYFLSSDQ